MNKTNKIVSASLYIYILLDPYTIKRQRLINEVPIKYIFMKKLNIDLWTECKAHAIQG